MTAYAGLLFGSARLNGLTAPRQSLLAGRRPVAAYEKIVEASPHEVEDWFHRQRIMLVIVDKSAVLD